MTGNLGPDVLAQACSHQEQSGLPVASRPLPCPPGLEKSSVQTPKFPLWLPRPPSTTTPGESRWQELTDLLASRDSCEGQLHSGMVQKK